MYSLHSSEDLTSVAIMASNSNASFKYKALSSSLKSVKLRACPANVFHKLRSISLLGLAGLYIVVSGRIVDGPVTIKQRLLESFKSVSTSQLNGNG